MSRGSDWTVRFKGENRSAVAAARGTDQEVGRLSRRVRTAGGDFRHTNAEMGKMTRGALAGSGAFRGFARSIAFASTAFLGGAGLTYLIRGAIKGASDLTEEVNKAKVVFGTSSPVILRWSRTAAVALGIARVEALKFAGTFGNMLVPMGFARSEAAAMAKQLVILAADMASFNNANPQEVLEALRAGLAGETEPLRRFGVFLNEARVQAFAMRLGLVRATVDLGKVSEAETKLAIARAKARQALKDYGAGTTQVAQAQLAVSAAERSVTESMKGSHAQLTAQQKAAAIYQIILNDTKDAQGDVARTSSSWANVQRRLRAVLVETQTALGQGLLPLMQPLLRRFTAYVVTLQEGGSRHEEFQRTLKDVIGGIRTAASVAGRLARALNSVAQAVGGWGKAFKLILAGVIVRQIGRIRLAILGVRAAFVATAATAVASETVMVASQTRLRGSLGRTRGSVAAVGLAFGGWPGAIAAAVALGIIYMKPLEDKIIEMFTKLDELGGREFGTDVPDWMEPTGKPKRPAGANQKYYTGMARTLARRGYDTTMIEEELFNAGATQKERNRAIGAVSGTSSPRARSTYGEVSLTGAARSSPPKQHVINFVRDVARIYGAPLQIMSGTRPGSRVKGTGDVSDHASGNAADIKTGYGRKNVEVGQAALIAAGMDPDEAQKKKSFVGTVGGVNILFATNVGGNHFDHVHVGLKSAVRGGTPTTLVSPSTPATSGGATGGPGDLTVGSRPTAPAKPKVADPGDVLRIRQTVRSIQRRLGEVIPVSLRNRIANQVRAINKLLTGVVTPKEYAQANKQLTALKRLFERSIDLSVGIRNVRKQLATMSTQIERMPAEARGRLRNQMAALRKALEQVTTTGGLNRVKAQLGKLAEAIEAAIEKAADRAESAADRLRDVLSRVMDKALEVFDAQTDALVKAARAQYEALTPAERALESLRARRQETDIGRRREDAQGRLALAQRLGDPEMIRDALRELEDIALEEQEAALERQAEAERKAADAAADREEERIRDERRLTKERFEARLAEMLKGFDDEEGLTGDRIKQLTDLLGEYGVDFASAGSLIGAAFAQGFRDAMGDLTDALGGLVDAINDLRRARGLPLLPRRRVPGSPPGGGHIPGGPGGPYIEGAAEGGVVMRPTVRALAEREPEAVIPLSRLQEVIGGLGGAGGPVWSGDLIVHGSVVSEHDLLRSVRRGIRKMDLRSGPLPTIARESGSTRLGQRRQRQ